MTDVTIAELPERLAEVLEEVRQGGSVRILDGNQPIARFEPIEEIEYLQRADRSQPLGKMPLPKLAFEVDFDPVDDLMREREKDRTR